MESSQAVNRAKQWQVALFPFNNAATNVYFAFYTYFTYIINNFTSCINNIVATTFKNFIKYCWFSFFRI